MTMRTSVSLSPSLVSETESAAVTLIGGRSGAAMVSMTQTHTAPRPIEADLSAVTVGDGPLSFEDVVAVARFDAPVIVSGSAIGRVGESRRIVEALADDTVPHYGVSTGFGALATKHIAAD